MLPIPGEFAPGAGCPPATKTAIKGIGLVFFVLIRRPPSEAESLLLQVTVGCSHNKCTYCAMYDDPSQEQFRSKPFATVAEDIAEAAHYAAAGLAIRRVFLCDGDALILPQSHLVRILEHLRRELPTVRRVGIYGDARSILRKTTAELTELRELGLGIVYHGAESGDDVVLENVVKGSTAAEAVEAATRLRAAGLRHSVMVMLGLGGTTRSTEHADATARLLTAMDPPFVGALTTTLIPGTPLHTRAEAGEFALPDPWGMLEELRTIIRDSSFTRCRFHSNHASNYVPLSLNLPTDRGRALEDLHAVLDRRDGGDLKPEHLRGL